MLAFYDTGATKEHGYIVIQADKLSLVLNLPGAMEIIGYPHQRRL